VIKKRRSIRSFSTKTLTSEQLSYLLWVSSGIQRKEAGFAFRSAPSAGALYPIETYCVIHRVERIEPGVYHYDIQHHRLDQLKKGDYQVAIAQAALDQEMANNHHNDQGKENKGIQIVMKGDVKKQNDGRFQVRSQRCTMTRSTPSSMLMGLMKAYCILVWWVCLSDQVE